jgi:uncharacterized protein (TIGR03067 family)
MNLVRALVLGVAVAAVSAVGADDKPGKVDAKKLVGEWKIKEGFKAGEKATGDSLKAPVVVTKDTVTLKGEKAEETFEFTYKVNADKGEIDLEITKPEPLKGAKTQGIVMLDGDTFKLCYHPMGEKRPTEFKSTKENGFYLFVMEKKK